MNENMVHFFNYWNASAFKRVLLHDGWHAIKPGTVALNFHENFLEFTEDPQDARTTGGGGQMVVPLLHVLGFRL